MIDVLKCDKPYNIDEARKSKGLPRRRRKDSRTTAYELTIRVPEEHREHFGGKRKLTKVVYVLNKKDDLRNQIKEFEEEKNRHLNGVLYKQEQLQSIADNLNADMPLGDYIDHYRELRSHGAIRKQTMHSEEHFAKYVKATIGHILLKDLRAEDVEYCILQVPVLSEKWALERRAKREENRKNAYWAKKKSKWVKPLKPIKVAGPDMQYKVLKFLREVLNDAVDREILARNVAKARFLTKNFKKSKPLIDPLSEADAAKLLHETKRLSNGVFKLGILLMLLAGLRPEEMLAVTPRSFQFGEHPQLRVLGSVEKGSTEISDYVKSDHAYRTIDLDNYTAEVAEKWIAIKTKMLKELGFKVTDKIALMSESERPMTYSWFLRLWKEFTKKIGLSGVRPYALRHTYATLSLAHGENIKTISQFMGHAKPSYTLDLYIGFVPSTAVGFGNRFMDSLDAAYDKAA